MPRNLVGEVVRRLRDQRGLTQEQLSAKCEVLGVPLSRGTLAKIEAGIRGVNDAELLALARALKVRIEDLYPTKSRNNPRWGP